MNENFISIFSSFLSLLLITCNCDVPGGSIQKTTEIIESKSDNNIIYILLVGLSGSGKSSTINLIFDNNIAEVGDSTSTTSEIFEYRVTLANNNETELRVIDTPGMEDTRGLENDARFLATLEKYLKSHSELRHRPPDVVLIFARYDDNRFYGEGAKFVKMLKGIGILNTELVTPDYSNLIFVMTHFMGVAEKDTKNPEPQKLSIENAITDFSLFPLPIRISLAENKGEEQELERVDLGFKLPNGEIYPHNLCESIKLILSHSSVNKSQYFSSLCFKNNSNVNMQLVTKVALLRMDDWRAIQLLEKLMVANLKTEDTEISEKLSHAFESLPKRENLPKDTLQYLQKALHLRLITKFSDLPQTNANIAKLFRELGRIQDVELVLKASFQIQVPILSFSHMVGNAYDTSEDFIMKSSPLDFKKEPMILSQLLGYRIPSCVSVAPYEDTKFYYEKFSTENEYINHRQLSLGIHKDNKNSPVQIKSGFNIISRGSCSSLLIEFRILKLELQNVEFGREFLTKLEGLPEFNVSVPISIQKWHGFLNEYGTHLVISAYAGGSIEITTQDYPCSSSKDLIADLRNLMKGREGSHSCVNSTLNHAKLQFTGGDSRFYSENACVFFGKAKSLHYLWRDSLINTPSMLYNDIKIKPIVEFLQNTGHNLFKFKKASEFFQQESMNEHPLMSNIQICETEKTNLITTIEELQLDKSKAEKNSLDITHQLVSTKQVLAETKIQLENEKGTSQVFKQNSLNCKSKEASLKSMLESEQRNSQSLKQVITQLESRINSLQQSLNSCDSCKTCLTSDHGFHHHHRRRHFHGGHHNRRLTHCQSQSLC